LPEWPDNAPREIPNARAPSAGSRHGPMQMTEGPGLVQIALCSADLTRTVRRYIEVFGFADAGAEALWGERVGQIQGLDADVTGMLWWLVGRERPMQLELFYHSQPKQHPLPDDWSPADLGWVRWGFSVVDFDDCLERLRA
jgi:hypothetical protein